MAIVRKGDEDQTLTVEPPDALVTANPPDDPPPAGVIAYPEVKEGVPNTDAVATFAAMDPEGSGINWDLKGADAFLFSIDRNGVLKFNASPDFEAARDNAPPADGADEGDGADDYTETTPDAAAGDNIYDLVIRASEVRPNGDTWPAQTESRRVKVVVTDVDEPGVVTFTQLQPEIGAQITASVTDPDAVTDANPDGDVTDVTTWAWTVSKVLAPPVLDEGNDDPLARRE